MGLLRNAVLATALLVWYPFHQVPKEYERETDRYSLPQEIEVKDANYISKNTQLTSNQEFLNGQSLPQKRKIKTQDIDFSKNFVIETNRYKLIKDEDWLPSRIVGHTLSLPGKLLFWDWDYGLGQDEERSKTVLALLEKDTTIKDITVRLNHNEAFYDGYRMFTEKKLRERNNFLARFLMGIPTTLGYEIWAEFTRGSYYNSLTKTAVCYSNIESVTAHEIGHHKDFSKFTSDWEYSLARGFPPVMLYQEWKASTVARDKLLEPKDNWQFDRYLIPAFGTYALATLASIVGIFFKKEEKKK